MPENWPSGHGVQTEAPASRENVPTSHFAHCTSVLLISTVEYVPGAHIEHALSWPEPANEPDAHDVQPTAAMRSEKVPTAHGKQ